MAIAINTAYPVRLTFVNPDGSVFNLATAGASGYRMVAFREYSTLEIAATSVGTLTDGSDGIIQGIITFTERGEYHIRGYATIGGTEFPGAALKVFAQ